MSSSRTNNIKDSPVAASGTISNASSIRSGRGSLSADENLHLFSKNRRSFSLASSNSDHVSDVHVKSGRISVGPAKMDKNGTDDLLSFPDGGKNDYDW